MTRRIQYSTLVFALLMLAPLHSGPAKAGPYLPAKAGPYVPPEAGPYLPARAGPYLPAKAGPYVPPEAGPYLPPEAGPYLPPAARQIGAAATQLRDVRGLWMQKEPGRPLLTTPPPMTAWAEERFRANRSTVGSGASLDANDPTLACMPPGVPYILDIPVPFELIPLEGRIIQLFEYNHNVRQLFTDGRPHPPDLQDSERAQWMGHSVASWEGDTLVVDTVGFNDRTWLDRAGHPHSSDLHLVERIRRLDDPTLEYSVTVDDPKAYTSPWQGRALYVHRPQWEILEHHCMPESDEYGRYHSRAWKH